MVARKQESDQGTMLCSWRLAARASRMTAVLPSTAATAVLTARATAASNLASGIAAALRARSARFLSMPCFLSDCWLETGGVFNTLPVFPFLPRPGPAVVNWPRVPFASLPALRSRLHQFAEPAVGMLEMPRADLVKRAHAWFFLGANIGAPRQENLIEFSVTPALLSALPSCSRSSALESPQRGHEYNVRLCAWPFTSVLVATNRQRSDGNTLFNIWHAPQQADFGAHPRGTGELRTWLGCVRKPKPAYLNRRLRGESWSTAVQPISFIPLSISVRISPSARSTPA
jgi:hypothetical protein